MLNKISELRANLRKAQDKKLALKGKQAREEIRHQTFIKKEREQIEKARKLKFENSFIGKVSKTLEETKKRRASQNRPSNFNRLEKLSKNTGSKSDSDRVREAISLGGNRKKGYDPFNL